MNLDELSQKLPRPLGKKSKCEGLQCKVQGLTWWETITNHLSVVKKNHPGVSSSCVSGSVNLLVLNGEGCHLMNHKGGMRHLMVNPQDFDKNASHPIRGIHIKFDMCFGSDKLTRFFRYRFSLGMLLGWTYSSTLWGVTPKHLTFFSTRNRWKSMSLPLHSLIPKNLGKLGVCFFFSKKSATGKC